MLLSARRLNGGTWEVTQNGYYSIYRFVYDPRSGACCAWRYGRGGSDYCFYIYRTCPM